MKLNRQLIVPLLVFFVSACSSGAGSGNGILSKIPSKVWEGGSLVTIRTKSNQPYFLLTKFWELKDGGNGSYKRELNAKQDFPAGEKSILVSVPANIGGYVELGVPSATPGATISCSIDSAGKELWKDEYVLEKALGANEACFVNVDIDDYSKGELSND